MAFDDAFLVFLQGCGSHQTDLDVGPHLLPVDVVAGLGILFHLALGHVVLQVFPGFGINPGIRFCNAFRQIRFRPADPDKTQGILFQDIPCFLGAHYIIR